MRTASSFVMLLAFVAIAAVGCTRQEPVAETPVPQVSPTPADPTDTGEDQPLVGQRVLFVVAPRDFRDEEYTVPHEMLTEAGAEAEVASLETGTAVGADGTEVEVTVAAKDATPDGFAAVVFVGGPGMMEYLDDPDLTGLAKRFAEADKVVAAICVAPAILAHADLLEGRRAAVWEGEEETLEEKGATLAGEDAVVDGKIVTAPGPEAARAFADAIEATLSAIAATE